MGNCKKTLDIETIVAVTLRIGVIISAVLVLAGFIMLIVTGNGGYPGGRYPTSIIPIITGAIQLKPYGVILLGIIVLMLTPVFRVAVSIAAFCKERDFLYAKITSAVLLILAASYFLGYITT